MKNRAPQKKCMKKQTPIRKRLRLPYLIKYYLKVVQINAVAVALLLAPMQAPAFMDNSTATAMVGVMNSFSQGFAQSMQQSMYAQRAAAMMSQLQPQVTPARFFPQCAVSVARQNFPANACSEITDPGALTLAESLTTLATNYENFYAQLTSQSQNTPFPAGLQCLEENRKKVASEINNKLNSLTGIQNQFKKNIQLFRDANQQILENMRGLTAELDGTDDKSIETKGRNMADYFQDDGCKEALDQGTLATTKGLRGVKGMFTQGNPPLNVVAGNLVRDEGTIRQHLDTQIQRIVADIQRDGIDQWIQTQGASLDRAKSGGLTAFGGMSKALQNELAIFGTEKAKIQQELQAVGVALPNFDSHFSQNVQGFKRNAKEFMRKRYINDCVSGRENTGIALSTDQILSSLRHVGAENVGTTMNDYKLALQNILNSDAFIEDKMAQIQQLQRRFAGNDIRVEYMDSGATRTLVTPYELYQQTIQQCSQRFETDDTFAPSTNTGQTVAVDSQSNQSRSEKVARAERYLDDARKLEAGFISRITQSVQDRVMNCGETAGTATRSGQCNTNAMSTDNENFCISTAVRCAGNVQSCFQKVEAVIAEKETKLKAHGQNYNANMQGLVARQEQIIQGLRLQVQTDQQFMQRFFPGADYKFPEDLFVKMPEMEDSEYGVRLIGGGNLAFLEDAAGKIDLLKTSLEEQKNKVDESIKEYMTNQQQGMEAEKARWAALKTQCESKAKEFRSNVAKANEAGAKAQQEINSKVGEFCYKYDRLRNSNNPTAGCQGDNSPRSLMGEATRIAAHLDRSVSANLDEYANLCAQSQNERTAGSGSGSTTSTTLPPLQQICENSGGWTGGLDAMATRLANNLPPAFRNNRSAILSYMRGTGDSVGDIDGFSDSSFGSAARELRELRSSSITGGGSDDSRTPASPTPATGTVNLTDANARLNEAYTSAESMSASSTNPAVAACFVAEPPATYTTPATPPGPVTTAVSPQTFLMDTLAYGGTSGSATGRTRPATVTATDASTRADETRSRRQKLASVLTCLQARQGQPPNAVGSAGHSEISTLMTALGNMSRPGTGSLDQATVAMGGAPSTTPPATTPSTPTSPTTGNPCAVATASRESAIRECSTYDGANTTSSSRDTCITRRTADFWRNPPGELAGINSRLASIESAFASSTDSTSTQLWSRIGERNSSTCAANGGQGRGLAGSMNNFLQMFDQRTMQPGQGGVGL